MKRPRSSAYRAVWHVPHCRNRVHGVFGSGWKPGEILVFGCNTLRHKEAVMVAAFLHQVADSTGGFGGWRTRIRT